MAQHGYLREYDEGWDRDEDRERGWRGRGRGPSESDEFWRDQRPGFMFGDDERERTSHYGPEHSYGGFQGDYSRSGREQGGFGGRGDWQHGRRSFSAHPDDHYRRWRDKQMAALDRDYEDYCREREAQFHRDFDDWRSRRRSSPEPLQAGMTQTGLSADPSGMTQAEREAAPATADDEPDPMADATVGTSRGRGRH
jgi:hypothetical protein